MAAPPRSGLDREYWRARDRKQRQQDNYLDDDETDRKSDPMLEGRQHSDSLGSSLSSGFSAKTPAREVPFSPPSASSAARSSSKTAQSPHAGWRSPPERKYEPGYEGEEYIVPLPTARSTRPLPAASTTLSSRASFPIVRTCKFAKAGCPFQGAPHEVEHHEASYCTPLYTQLAHYKMLASTSASSSSESRFRSPTRKAKRLPNPSTSAKPELPVPGHAEGAEEAPCSLKEQIARLQSDLSRAQKELEEEKRLRTERLRRAGERVLELMSISSLGEGKVEVLQAQLHAERELREKLEEELDSLRPPPHTSAPKGNHRSRRERRLSSNSTVRFLIPSSPEKVPHEPLSEAAHRKKRERSASEELVEEQRRVQRARW